MKKLLLIQLIMMFFVTGFAQPYNQNSDFTDHKTFENGNTLKMPAPVLSAVSVDEKPIKRGNLIISGGASLYFTKTRYESGTTVDNYNNFHFGIYPGVLAFVADGLALGGDISIGLNSSDGDFGYSIGIGPELRYYFDFGLFLKAGASYNFSHSDYSKSNFFIAKPGIGFAIFFNQKVALEPCLFYNFRTASYDYTTTESNYNSNQVGIELGLTIFL